MLNLKRAVNGIILLFALVSGCQVIAEPVPEPTAVATTRPEPTATPASTETPRPRCEIRRQQATSNRPDGYQFLEFDIGGALPEAIITLSVNDEIMYRCRPQARDEVTGAAEYFAVVAPAGEVNLVLLSDTGIEPWTMSLNLDAPRYFIVNLTASNEWQVSVLTEPPIYE